MRYRDFAKLNDKEYKLNSIAFPKMFNTSTTLTVKGHDATAQDMLLLFYSDKGELKGDPFFGIRLKRFMYNQNNQVLEQVLIDEIYSQLLVFMPQLTVVRNNIKIKRELGKMIISIKAINKVDFTTNMYEAVLLQDNERM